MSSELVAVHIPNGPESGYMIHKGFLCGISSFFSKAFDTSTSFKEATEGSITLQSDISSANFAWFLEWLYSRDGSLQNVGRDPKDTETSTESKNAPNVTAKDTTTSIKASEPEAARADCLLDLHIFAQEYDIPQLGHDTFLAFLKQVQGLKDPSRAISATHVALAFDRLQNPCPWYRLLVSVAVYSGFREHPRDGCPDDYPKEFLWDVNHRSRRFWLGHYQSLVESAETGSWLCHTNARPPCFDDFTSFSSSKDDENEVVVALYS